MSRLNELVDVRIIFSLFLVHVIIALVLCHFILFIIAFTKTLHSPANLLLCNTCFATILHFIITTIQICLFYTESILGDWWCRILAYLTYSFLHMVCYSYVIQALSRLLFIAFHQHHYFLQYKFHFILVICQILISFLTLLSSLVTKDVVFRSFQMCYIQPTRVLHVAASFVTGYIAPFGIIIIIYTIIYCRVIRSSAFLRGRSHETKRDLQVMRNILVLFLVFLSAGIPSIIYMIITYTRHSSSVSLYMMPLLGTPFAVVVEKICLIFLNHEIRKATRKLLEDLHLIRPSNHVTDLAVSTTYANKIPYHMETVNITDKRVSIITIS